MDQAASRYKFDNVLVAGARLLADMGSNRDDKPKILVLNDKLGSCTRKQQRVASSEVLKCQPSCCLQVERLQFRRRQSEHSQKSSDELMDCLAHCSERRSLNIELRARAELKGKLVILALSRTNDLFAGGEMKRCQVTRVWSYAKFNPVPELVQPSSGQVFYSELGPNQVPSLSLESAQVSYDRDDGRECISLNIQSPLTEGSAKDPVPSTKEILLINELTCRQSRRLVLNESANQQAIEKIHLFALLNRNSTSAHAKATPMRPNVMHKATTLSKSNSTATITMTTTTTTRQPKVLITSVEVETTTTETTTTTTSATSTPVRQTTNEARLSPDISPESYIDYPPAATVSNQKRRAIVTLEHHNASGFETTKANDSLNAIIPSNGLTIRPLIGPHHQADLDSLKFRLRPGSVLVLFLCSAALIIAYTICLLLYLKSRPKPPAINKRSRTSDNAITLATPKATKNDSRDTNTSEITNISAPFNLQMPPATRTRLDIILGRARRGRQVKIRGPGSIEPDRSIDHWSIQHRTMAKTRSQQIDQMPENTAIKSTVAYEDLIRHSRQISHDMRTFGSGKKSTGADQHDKTYRYPLACGTIRVVRALRHAATVARFKLGNSFRYQPNLSAIPEGDRDYYEDGLGESRQDSLIEQFDSLIQEAMNRHCSHLSENLTHCMQQPMLETLFAKPVHNSDVNSGPDVSRKRILRVVKLDGLNEQQEHSERKHDGHS